MIIKGGPAGNIAFWAKHLLRDDTNELAHLIEVRGLMAEDLPGALREMQAIAAQSRSRGNFMYQANINPPPGAALSAGQFAEAVDLLEEKLGFLGRQRVVVEHVKGGRRHYHVIWNRVDIDTLKVADITGNYAIHQETARQLERRFGLPPQPRRENEGGPVDRPPELWERRAAERSGINREQVAQDMARIWDSTRTGAEFRAAAATAGYLLAKGDRRDFCIVDRAGDAHSLARRLREVRVEDVRQRFADLDRDSLPSVARAKATQRLRGGFRKAAAVTVARRRLAVRGGSGCRGLVGGSFRCAADQMSRPTFRGGMAARGALKLAHATATLQLASESEVRAAAVRPSAPPRAALRAAAADAPLMPDLPRQTDAESFDDTAAARAEGAYRHEFAKWQALIDALFGDKSLTAELRAAALATLRARQRREAEAAHRRVIEEEKQRVRAARRAARSRRQPRPRPRFTGPRL